MPYTNPAASKVDAHNFEEKITLFWEECDSWVADRLHNIAAQGIILLEDDIAEIEEQVERTINSFFEKGIQHHGESFTPHILIDLHHLFFEMRLKKLGVVNEKQIHKYKDNGLLGLSVIQDKVKLDHALFIMEVNRAHLMKKGGNQEEVCEDCICGKKEEA